MMRVPGFVLGVLCLVGCRFAPTDPVVAADRVAESGRFLRALQLLDQVAPGHQRYAEARSLAQALERRIRTSHERVLDGLALRGEWRDEAAIECFEEALAIWSNVAGASGLITATRARMEAYGDAAPSPGLSTATPVGAEAELPAVHTSPVRMPRPAVEAPSVATTTPTEPPVPNGLLAPRPAAPSLPTADPASIPAAPGVADSRAVVDQRLAVVRRLMIQGETGDALAILRDLWDESPDDQRVVVRLVRMLHQRALLAYGQGRLGAAVDDWQKVMRLQVGNEQVAAFLRAAQTELAGRRKK